MGKAKNDAKKIRRAVNQHADSITEQVAINIIMRLYTLSLWERIKWATKIVRGLPMRESLWSWMKSVPRRISIEIIYQAKCAWARCRPEYVPDAVVKQDVSDVELNWMKKDKDAETKTK